MRFVLLAAAVLAVLPSVLRAQEGCGRTSGAADELREHLAPIFYGDDEGDVAIRGTRIRRLSPADTPYVVRDDAVCRRVVAAAVARMSQENKVWADGEEGDFSATVIRFGEYYAVVLLAEDPPITLKNGVLTASWRCAGATLVLRADTLEYLLTAR